MNISITPELEKFVQSLVKSGMYNSASEVIRDALRLREEKQELRKKRIEQLNAEIQKGLDSLAAGKVVTPEEMDAELDAIIRRYEQ
ncbi:MAG: type II toxin-antitoxin system ParD family antitoxin [Bacteroidota bacterium]